MENDKVNVALNALNDLVRDELDATDAGRYHRAGRVLTLAASLTSLHARRVADAVDQEMGQIDDDGNFGVNAAVANFGAPMRMARRFTSPAEDMVRVLADVLPKALAAQRAVPPARELAELLEVRDRLRGEEDAGLRERVQARIAALVDLTTAPSALIGAGPPDRRLAPGEALDGGDNGAGAVADAAQLTEIAAGGDAVFDVGMEGEVG